MVVRTTVMLSMTTPKTTKMTTPSTKMIEGNGVGSSSTGADRSARDTWMTHVTIERVSTKQRALDVHVFRKWSITAQEHIEKQTESLSSSLLSTKDGSTHIMTEEEAIDHLMRGYGSDGRYMNTVSKNDPTIQFVTLYQPHHTGWNSDCYIRQNGVVAAVDIQARNADSDVSIDDIMLLVERSRDRSVDGESDLSFCESSSLPSHVYLSNLRVDDQMQGHGLGAALMAAVTSHVTSTQTTLTSMILLTVQNDNHSAIRIYRREGYGYLEKNDVFGRMFKITSKE